MIRAKIEVAKIDEYTIFYDPARQLFCLNDAADNEIATAGTQQQIQAEIKQVNKQSFKLPIPAIKSTYSGVYQGRITSVNVHRGTAFFSYDDKKYGRAEKVALRYDRSCFELTESNSVIVSTITALIAQINELKAQVEVLKEGLETPINADYFSKGGEPE